MEAVSNGLRIHFEVRGQGPPVVLLHGYPLSSRLWDEVADHLSPSYRLIIPDLRGHGRSEAGESASMEAMATDVRAVLEAADEDRPAVLVGMSMGGYVALAFAQLYPASVRALALVASRAAGDSPKQAEARRSNADRVLREGPAAVVDEMMAKLWGPEAPEQLRESWRAKMAATSPQGIAAALRGMAERRDSRAFLDQSELPLLVLAGGADQVIPLDEARALGGTLAVFEGAGHMLPVEEPQGVAEALRGWLDALP